MVEVIEEQVEIFAPGGALRGVLAYPAAGRPSASLVIAGPHPFLGGHVDNNIVSSVGQAGAERGWMTLRFAYREGGGDMLERMDEFWRTGYAPEDGSRLEELRAAVAWAGQVAPVRCLVAYSFGCWLASRLVAEDGFAGAVAMIAPTVVQHDFSPMRRWPGTKMVAGSDNDFATPLAQLRREVGSWAPPCELMIVPGAEHFFRGRTETLNQAIFDWLERVGGECRRAA